MYLNFKINSIQIHVHLLVYIKINFWCVLNENFIAEIIDHSDVRFVYEYPLVNCLVYIDIDQINQT